MTYRHQPAIAGGTEPHPLPCLRPVAHRGEHLRSGQHQLDWATDDPGRKRGQDHVRPGADSGPEPATQVWDEDSDVGLRQIEHRRKGLARKHRILARVVHSQPVTFPAGHRGEQTHRIVGHRCGGEGLVVDHVGAGQRGGDITAVDVLIPTIEHYRGAGIVDTQYRRVLHVVDLDQLRRLESLFTRPRNHDGHVLAVVHNPVVPQREWWRGTERVHRCLGKSWRVLVRDHRKDARRGLRRCGVDAPDSSSRDRGLHQDGMREVGKSEI